MQLKEFDALSVCIIKVNDYTRRCLSMTNPRSLGMAHDWLSPEDVMLFPECVEAA